MAFRIFLVKNKFFILQPYFIGTHLIFFDNGSNTTNYNLCTKKFLFHSYILFVERI